jgi:hypothetical protein
MQLRLLVILAAAMALATTLYAQQETPAADEPVDTDQPAAEDPDAISADTDEQDPAEEPPTAATEPTTGDPGLDSFRPSEEISSDRSVAFPNDI